MKFILQKFPAKVSKVIIFCVWFQIPENILACPHFWFILGLDIEFQVGKHFFQNFEGITVFQLPVFFILGNLFSFFLNLGFLPLLICKSYWSYGTKCPFHFSRPGTLKAPAFLLHPQQTPCLHLALEFDPEAPGGPLTHIVHVDPGARALQWDAIAMRSLHATPGE